MQEKVRQNYFILHKSTYLEFKFVGSKTKPRNKNGDECFTEMVNPITWNMRIKM